MFSKVLTRYSKKFLKKKTDSRDDQDDSDDDASLPTPPPTLPVIDYSYKIDRILKFYIFFKRKVLQKLEGLDFDPSLPESSQKVIISDQTVEGLKESDLSQFPNKFYGIVLFKKTLEELEHRITHLSKVRAGIYKNVKEMVEAHEEAVAALNVTDLLTRHRRPGRVVNGYWFYDNLPKFKRCDPTDTRSVIYMPPNAVANLRKLPQKGTFKCESNFKIDPDISFAIRDVKNTVNKIDGFFCLEEIVSTVPTGYTEYPDMLLTCEHGFSTPDSWRCSGCLGNVTSYTLDLKSYISCENCGICKYSTRLAACFCKSDNEWKKKVERLEDLVEKLESQIASMQMTNELNPGSFREVE